MATHLSNDPITVSPNPYTQNAIVYPKPEAEYEEIVQNPNVFFQKLQSFHTSFGTKFKVPVLGGKDLELHRLFVEVTSRGGIEKVISERKWKEVVLVLNPYKITSASFVLRKYYLSLLYHFEQVYYFRKEVPSNTVTDPVSSGSEALHVFQDDAHTIQFSGDASLNVELGSSVSGTIDAKFEYGYLISVNLGSEELKGVLYHTPMALAMSRNTNSSIDPLQRNRKRHQLAPRDPSQPKSHRSGYNFFFAEHYTRLKPMYHGHERDIAKKVAFLWSKLTEAEKQVYQDKGLRDKERYRTEMSNYMSSIHPQAQ